MPHIKPVSTIGAGDNFNAGLLYSLLAKDLRKADLATLSSEQLTDIAAIADSFSIEVCCSMDNYVGKNFRAIPDCRRHQEPDTDC
ncbi:MAG: PfkB family carbohydrate kinase [Bacteroidales bacterium]|nr:PfkB family carbohydrate kinase [Bacteroidales bacterium]